MIFNHACWSKRALRAGWYDFATRVAKPRVKAKSYHPNRKALLGQQEWLKIIQPRAQIYVLHSLIVLENHTTTGAIQKICMGPVVEKSYNHWFHTKKFIWQLYNHWCHINFLYGTSGCMTFQPLVPYKIFVWHRWLYDFPKLLMNAIH